MKTPVATPSTAPHHRSYANAHNSEQADEREMWHKLVVKVISWKDGLLDGGIIKITDKITTKEWNNYYKRIIKTNTSYSKDRVLNTLKETKELIQRHGGFE